MMNQRSFQRACASGTAVLALTMLALNMAQAQTPSNPAMPSGMNMPAAAAAAGGGHDMKAAMMKDMDAMQKMPMSGDVDIDFAMMMKMHHQQALKMAEAELVHGKSPEMKLLAKQIVTAQKKEIAQFDKFLAARK